MRSLALVAALAAAFSVPQNAHGRAFWQTYGATAPSPSGHGCAWNVNSDYFVPRSCDSCGYGLFSACKTSHSISPACRNLHPVYAGYCTPFGSCHYKRQDHVYAKKCGCTPLSCVYGPWHLEKCRKHGCRRTPALDGGCEACGSESCGVGCCGAGIAMAGGCAECSGDVAEGFAAGGEHYAVTGPLPNVEPLGGEILGTIQAFPAGLASGARGGMGMSGAMPGAMPMPMPMPMPVSVPGANPLPVGPQPSPAGEALMLPNLFGS